jgi:hypothetical protein
MSNTKFATGAFVFSRARSVRPMLPGDAGPVAHEQLGERCILYRDTLGIGVGLDARCCRWK